MNSACFIVEEHRKRLRHPENATKATTAPERNLRINSNENDSASWHIPSENRKGDILLYRRNWVR